MYHASLAIQSIYGLSDEGVKRGIRRRGVSFLENGREWRLPDLLHANDLGLYGESEEGLRMMVGQFAEWN